MADCKHDNMSCYNVINIASHPLYEFEGDERTVMQKERVYIGIVRKRNALLNQPQTVRCMGAIDALDAILDSIKRGDYE